MLEFSLRDQVGHWTAAVLFGLAVFCVVPMMCLAEAGTVKSCAPKQDSVDDSVAQFCTDQEMARDFARRKGWLKPWVDPDRRVVADGDCQKIKSIFDRMADAYRKGSTNEIRDLYAKIPACVTNLTRETYVALSGEFSRMVGARFLQLEQLLDFDDLAAFRRYVDGSLLCVEVMADLDLRRRDYAIVQRVDAQVVNVLKKYMSGLDSQNRFPLSRYAGHCLESWCEKIDSTAGYTRQYMIFDVSLQLMGDPDLTWRRLVQSIRHHADALVRAGHAPKWLDEDFPLPSMTAEEKARDLFMAQIAFPPSCVPSPAQSNELLRSVQRVLKAYSERSPKDLRTEIARMPMIVTNVTEDVFLDVSRPLWDALFGNCHLPRTAQSEEFSTVSEFEAHMEVNVMLATYLGEIVSMNFPWDVRLLRIDELMVKMLNLYKDKFETEGIKDLLSSVAGYEQRWLTFMESEKGLSRTYLKFKLYQEPASSDHDRARMARRYVGALMKNGCTPRWLDKDYPLSGDGKE